MLRFGVALPSRSISLHTEAAGSAPPDAFGVFRVLHQIGAGALGPVFRAYDAEQAKLVAVKLFRIDLPPERVHQLVAELELLIGADLSHPGIAAPLATGIAGAAAYLAQDFVAADSLDTVVREHGAAPPAEALRVVAQIAGALDSAAPAGVFHGSLHPRDVLISTDDTRITGVGVTQALARVGFAAPVRRPYAAPERSASDAWNRRADIFSLAALAHELLWAKRISATGRDAAAAITAVRGADLNRLRALFARALADDPWDRFETAGEFVTELEAALSAVATADTQPPAHRPPANFRRSTPDSRLPTSAPLLPLDDAGPEDTVAAPPPGPPTGPDADDTVPDTALELEDRGRDPGVIEDRGKDPGVIEDRGRDPGVIEDRGRDPGVIDDRGRDPGVIDDADDTVPETPVQLEDAEDTVPDVALRAAEEERFAEAETAPSVVESESDAQLPTLATLGSDPDLPKLGSDPDFHLDLSAPPPPAEPEPVRPPTLLIHPGPSSPAFPIDTTRSGLWPIALALFVGIALGFSAGYWLGNVQRDQAPEAVVAEAATKPASEPAPRVPAAAAATEVQLPRSPSASADRSSADIRPPSTALRPGKPDATGTPGNTRPAGAPAAATGRITVRSTPAGARVTVDGRDVGKTPVIIRDLARGAHTVRVSRDGYRTQERRVSVTASQPNRTVTVQLPRAAARASAPTPAPPSTPPAKPITSLVVESRPTGATVVVDGKRIGTTPISMEEIASGTYAVRLELDGYKPWTASVRVVEGEKNRVAASLER